ncbi:hypothetical protein P615_14075 [Brevibacillus laterosporus PE36]|nr:hypothetical protein P615_14075 [Brevibacillus laterosporus PE36]
MSYGFTWIEIDDAQALREWAESKNYSPDNG